MQSRAALGGIGCIIDCRTRVHSDSFTCLLQICSTVYHQHNLQRHSGQLHCWCALVMLGHSCPCADALHLAYMASLADYTLSVTPSHWQSDVDDKSLPLVTLTGCALQHPQTTLHPTACHSQPYFATPVSLLSVHIGQHSCARTCFTVCLVYCLHRPCPLMLSMHV